MDLESLCEKIRSADDSILSLTIGDAQGRVLIHSFGSEYEEKYHSRASEVRARAGLYGSLMIGIEGKLEEVFGETRGVVRMHREVNLIVIPCASRTKSVTLLTKPSAHPAETIRKVEPLLEDL
jgi:hypothetical protein